jgi:hypothetical protein
MANVNRYEVDSNTVFLSGKALYLFRSIALPQRCPFWTHIRSCSQYDQEQEL